MQTLLLLLLLLGLLLLGLSDFRSSKTFPFYQPIVIRPRLQIGDNIPEFRTVSNFYLVNN